MWYRANTKLFSKLIIANITLWLMTSVNLHDGMRYKIKIWDIFCSTCLETGSYRLVLNYHHAGQHHHACWLGTTTTLADWAQLPRLLAGHHHWAYWLGTTITLAGWAPPPYLLAGQQHHTCWLGTTTTLAGWALPPHLLAGHHHHTCWLGTTTTIWW